jgi:hypothetical protein
LIFCAMLPSSKSTTNRILRACCADTVYQPGPRYTQGKVHDTIK